MRRLSLALIAAVSALAFTQIASAADMPVKASAPAVVAPVYNWTGFYIGAHLGYGWGEKEWSNEVDPTGSTLGFLGSGTANGMLGGLQAGYNYQINWLVLGIEGDFSWADVSKSFTCFQGEDTCTSKAEWFASFTGRIGTTFDRALLYIKGGVAWVHDKHTDDCPTGCGVPTVFEGFETRAGWTVGAGVEYAFTPNWSGKIEYDYMDFGTKSPTLTSSIGPESIDIKQQINAIKVGVNYKFY